MPTRSIELTDDEANDLQALVGATGESEAAALKRALARGLKDLRIEQAIRVFEERGSSSAAAAIAGMPRAHFLQLLIDEGITILHGPATLGQELEGLALEFEDPRLGEIARRRSDVPA